MASERTSPLDDVHRALGARFTVFAGWLMPERYDGIIEEHMAVRQAAGLFDLSHMGEIEVSGPGAEALLQLATTNDVSRLRPGRAQYTLLCNEAGGVLDDFILYRLDNRYMLVPNAANRERDFDVLTGLAGTPGLPPVSVIDRSDETALLAIQGPSSVGILQSVTQFNVSGLSFYSCAAAEIAGVDALVARTGYTGEDGFELYMAAVKAVSVWHKLMEAGAGYGLVPCGLGARDTLRLEAGLLLCGRELSPDVNPIKARLERFVKLDKASFVGKDAIARIAAEGPNERLVGFEMLNPLPAHMGYPILEQGTRVGAVTSGSYGPAVQKFIGMGYVPPRLAAPGTELAMVVRGRPARAKVVKLPFYTRGAR